MGFIIFIIFLALLLSLLLSKVKYGRVAEAVKIFRYITVAASISIFIYWFVKKSTVSIAEDALSLQVINKLPQSLDFYVIGVGGKGDTQTIDTQHIGNIRPEYYRLESLKMTHSDEYWVVGYLGKKNMVYFSQHYVPNKNIDQVLEVNNYIIQSEKLASQAKKQIEAYNFDNIQMGIWVTLDLLLIFINVVSLLKRNKA